MLQNMILVTHYTNDMQHLHKKKANWEHFITEVKLYKYEIYTYSSSILSLFLTLAPLDNSYSTYNSK